MKTLQLLFITITFLTITSCSKNNATTPDTISNRSVNIYIAGVDGYVAKFWKNGVPVAYSDGKQPAGLTSVYVSGTDVYVGGFDGKIAKVWKNGTPTSLTNGAYSAIVYSVFVSGSDVYAVGDEALSTTNTIAKIWKNGVATSLTDGNKNAVANSVFVSGTDVYVVGYEGNIAKLWKNGIETNLTVACIPARHIRYLLVVQMYMFPASC